MVAKKCQQNFSFTAKHKPKFLVTRWKILLANFSFKNRNEENAFGAAMMAIFPLTIRLNTNMLIIFTPTTENPWRTNRMSAIYTVSCDCQMFQVNFIPSPVSTFWRRNVPDWKLPFGSLVYVQNDLSFCVLSRRSMDCHVEYRNLPLISSWMFRLHFVINYGKS